MKFDSWTRNDKLTLVKNDDYWGDKSTLDTLIIRPIADNAARLQALQTGEIQGYDLVEPQDIATIEGDSKLQIIDRPAFNVAYVGFNIAKKPTDDIKVREAIAYGLDRQAVVDNFYSGRAELAKEFMPPEVVGYADDVPEYTYDPEKAKQILTDAGYTLPVPLEFWYPTDVSRPYMPDPKRNFEAFAASLNKSGFKVTPKSAPWNPDYLGRADEGNAGNLRMLGWTGDYGDADNFIGTFFQSPQKAWGTTTKPLTKIEKLLNDAEIETDEAKRETLYKEANRRDHDRASGRALRALQAGPRVRCEGQGLRRKSDDERVVLDGDDRGVEGGKLESGGRHAAFRRPPAPAPDPDPARALAPRLLLDQGAAGQPGDGAARRAGDARVDRGDQQAVRPRQADLRAVLRLRQADGVRSNSATSVSLAAARHRRVHRALPGHDRAGALRDVLLDSPRAPARLPGGETLRRLLRPLQPVRVATRDLDPDLRARDHPQVHLRGAARVVTRPSAG